MKKLKLLISWIFILGILFLIGWIGFKSLQWLRSIDTGLAATVITASAGLIGLIYSQWHSKSRDIAEGHRKYKIEVYYTYFNIVERFLGAAKKAQNIDTDNLPKDLKEEFDKLNRGMIVWASPSVISAWLKFRKEAGKEKPTIQILYIVDDVLQAIRKDLGNSNFALKRGDLIKLYLNNPNELEQDS